MPCVAAGVADSVAAIVLRADCVEAPAARGAFVQAKTAFVDGRMNLVVGARYDDNSICGTSVNP